MNKTYKEYDQKYERPEKEKEKLKDEIRRKFKSKTFYWKIFPNQAPELNHIVLKNTDVST